MPQFTTLTGSMAPLPIDNVDTDQIIPASYLKVTDKSGLGEGLFSRWRQGDGGRPNPDFFLNRVEHANARILLAGDNFGCGSSREHAPWALLDFGFRAVISTRFADIFRNNSLKNGLLVVTVSPEVQQGLFAAVGEDPSTTVTIDLSSQQLTLPSGDAVDFDIEPFAKECLLRGVDQLSYLLEHSSAIEAYEADTGARIDTLL